jgi:arginyl-tRNA synthetase
LPGPVPLIEARVREAIVGVFGADFQSAEPAVHRSNFADYQADAALRLAKPLKQRPLDIANAIRQKLDLSGLVDDEAAVTVTPPGFVNITLGKKFLADAIEKLALDPRAGVDPAERPEVVVIDYSSPNVAKEMHVGNLRSTIIGDALARTLGFLGHRVIRHNHIGDWGTPFGMLIEHLVDLDLDAKSAIAAAHAIDMLVGGGVSMNEFYQDARKKFDSDPAFADRSRKRVVLLQGGDADTLAYWRRLVDTSRRYFERIYARLGVLLEDTDIRGESAYNDLLPVVARDLEALGLARRDQGALCVFLDEFKGKDGEIVPVIVQKSDGGFGYAATDLAALRYRVHELGGRRMLYVIGSPQAQHLAMVFGTAKKAGWLPEEARTEHVNFGSVLGKDKKMFKTRSGDSVKLADLLEEAVERARAAVKQKNPSLGEAEVSAVAVQVGIGAVKYADLSSDRIKDYIFDFDRMLAFEGNTGPYLQYAHARIASIERKAADEGITTDGTPAVVLTEETERKLAVELLELETAVRSVADALAPHKLTTYLFDLATTFTAFYENCPVLRAEDPAVRASRLWLCKTTRKTLAVGLGLLGIGAPERM